MVEKLSAKLSELSVSVKRMEDDVSAAQTKARRELAELRDAAQSDAQRRISEINAKVSMAQSMAATNIDEWKHKLKADADALKAKIDRHKQQIDAKHKEQYAEDLEADVA